jgi:glycosyltransferase involved in cell wall biosynthesis
MEGESKEGGRIRLNHEKKEFGRALSANAVPGLGGQGLNLRHMIDGYAGDDPGAVQVFCQGPYGDHPVHVVGQSRLARLMSSIPVVRRYRDVFVELNEKYFDASVASSLTCTEFFQGATGQCLKSLRRARQLGARTRLDVITAHAEVYHKEQTEECWAFGIRPFMSRSLFNQTLQEYSEADQIRVMSEVVRRMFLERGFDEKKVFTANPPLDWDKLPDYSVTSGKWPGSFTVGFAGLLEPAKGFHYLVQAFRRLDDPDARLQLWGSPGARPVYEFVGKSMHEDPRIEMRSGSIREAGYDNVYGGMSVLVHPSLADGFGYVVAEAMACGRPVIVTENTGAADLVQDGKNGFIVPIRDTDAIHERLEFLQKSPEKCVSMGKAAFEAAQNLTLENFRRKIRQDW